ncbi:MAG: hypothetical protein IJH14_02125 [Solobacterium sp.]|nr:hypothetical protein [Solobacterium sp.]
MIYIWVAGVILAVMFIPGLAFFSGIFYAIAAVVTSVLNLLKETLLLIFAKGKDLWQGGTGGKIIVLIVSAAVISWFWNWLF